ncbi:hypothetical protein L6R53_10805 [Myxococcota bacterium]|nr:hypothetical protein [Myxococcota bacterium]
MRPSSSSAHALLALLALSSPARAQDDAAAGLFTEARQLPLVSQAIHVVVDGDEALLHLSQVFVNDGEALGQADYQLHLPQGASVESFGFWSGDRLLEATLQAREEAQAQHRAAAAEGRATALLGGEGQVQSFSVYPVEAGALKQVELRLRLPVEAEGGRRELLLPVDELLGQPGVVSTVSVDLAAERPLADLGLSTARGETASHRTLRREERSALLATTTHEALVLYWQEEAPPLDLDARAVPTPEGTALALRVALNAGDPEHRDGRVVAVFVDGSRSMARRSAAVDEVLARVQAVSHGPVSVHRVEGARVTWTDLAGAMEGVGCEGARRCLALTDAQLPGISGAEGHPAELIVLADAHEAIHFAGALPPRAARYQPGVDPPARLRAAVDQAILPVLTVTRLRVDGRDLSPLGAGPWRVAEGGLLRLSVLDGGGEGALVGRTLRVEVERDGQAAAHELVVQEAGAAGSRVRRAVYRDLLASMMGGWKAQPEEGLKERIVALSLREGIPTAFTSLQVDDPELSLVAIKPGDPTLTVDGAPGVTDVVAWYPFGQTRRLRAEGGTFSDRFLVPRGWEERAYRVDTFSRRADGRVEQQGSWYVLDEAAPEARVTIQDGDLVVDTGAGTPEVGAVEVHAPGQTWRLSLADPGAPGARTWRQPLAALPEQFTVVVRDRAGNVARWPARVEGAGLVVQADAAPPAAGVAAPVEALPLQAGEGPMRVDGHLAVVHLADQSLRFDARGLGLRSLRLTAAARVDGRLLLGTAGGDLLAVRCEGAECVARRLETDQPEHPVTGIVALPDGSALVGILGAGLRQVRGDRVGESPIRVGSRFVTGLVRAPDGDVLIGTAYNGLWRLPGGQGAAVRSTFPHEHVAGLRAPGDLLAALPVVEVEVSSGHGRFLRLARDRFRYDGPGLNELEAGATDLVDLAVVGDRTWVAGFDSGLWRVGPEGERTPVPLDLRVAESRINALALHAGRLWLATEGGLLSLDPDRPEASLRRELPDATHDLDSGPGGLAIATSQGLYVMDEGGTRRVDAEGPLAAPAVGTGRYLSVAWHDRDLYAGTLDGLVHLGAGASGWEPRPVTVGDGLRASWVTALLSDGDRLWVGTYSDGLWTVEGGEVSPVTALAGQWVPPHALARLGDALWVGGIGMAPVRLSADGEAVAVPVPVRDVNAVLPAPEGGLWLATSDGLVRVEPPVQVRR